MRQKYETDADLMNEKDVANKIASARGYMMQKLAPMSRMDYAAFSTEGLKAFIEIKRRKVLRSKYDTVMLGMEKVLWARQVSKHFGVKSYFFVQWNDVLGYVCLDNDCELDMGGRTDRGDPLDVELLAYFKISDFKELTDDKAQK